MALLRKRHGETTVRTFAVLHNGAKFLLEKAESDIAGDYYNSMMSLVSTAFFLEAYCNHYGQEKIANWEDRRGPRAKLLRISRELGYSPDFQKPPYSSFSEIFKFRNFIAHGKTETLNGSWLAEDQAHDLFALETAWEKLCVPHEARRLFEDAEAVVSDIHRKSGSSGSPWGLLRAGITASDI